MDKIWQEIHCPESGGGCGGYIMVGLNKHLNHIARIICPKCSHQHQRRIKDGHVQAKDRWSGEPVEEICPTMAAWSEEPKTIKMGDVDFSNERDGAVITDWEVFADQQLRDLWREHYGGGES